MSIHNLPDGVAIRALQARLKKEILDRIDPSHDDVYMLLLHTGDAYAMLCFMEAMIRRHKSRNPVVAVWSHKHEQLAAMVCPGLPRVHLSGPLPAAQYFERLIRASQIRVGPFRVFLCPNYHVLHQRIDNPIYRRLYPHMHALQQYERHLGLKLDQINVPRLRLLPEAEAEALREAQRHGLDVRRFVMLIPEAYSRKSPPWTFWKVLAMAMRARGYDVYVNALFSQSWPAEAGQTFALSLGAAYALAWRAKRIIALRSGMLEPLVQSGVPMDVIYSDAYFYRYSCLRLFPHAKMEHVLEYDIYTLGNMGCLNALLKRPMP